MHKVKRNETPKELKGYGNIKIVNIDTYNAQDGISVYDKIFEIIYYNIYR